jgi:broad specificity phosphatase PhoE
MRLYIFRHTESVGTVGTNLQHPDEPLTEVGHKEAELLAEYFSSIPLEQVIAGPMLRTQQTAAIIADPHKLPVDVVEHFRGMKRPTEQMQFPKDHPRVYEIDSLIKDKFHDIEWRYGDGDTFTDIKQRVLAGLYTLAQSDKKHVALLSHSVIMRYIVGCMLFGDSLTSHQMENVLMGFKIDAPGIIVAEYQAHPLSMDVWSAKSKTGWVLTSIGRFQPPTGV